MRTIKAGATSQSVYFEVLDSASTAGGRKTGIAYNSAGLTAYYARNGGSATAITLATLTNPNSAWATGGFKEVEATNMPGVYRLDVPDAAFAAGAVSVVITIKGAAGMVQASIDIQLTAVDLQDAVRFGMTALPNAAAEAAGGLYTRGTGAGQINQANNGQIDVNAARLGGTTQTGRDIGANVLLSPGTGTGQISLSSGAVTVGTNNDKTNYGISSAAVQAIWDAATSALTTSGSIGKRIVDFLTGDIFARLGAPAGASIAADIAAVKSDTGTLTTRLSSARAGYLDNLNVGGVVASQADITALNQSASRRILLTTVGQYERPETGTVTYQIEARTYDGDGAAVNADSTPTLTATGLTSGSLSGNLGSATNPATGVYRWAYTVSSTDTLEQVRFDISAVISSATFTLSVYTQVADFVSATWTSTDQTHLTAIFNKLPSKTYLTGTANSDGDVQLDEATGTPADSAGTTTLLSRLTSTRAGYLDNLSGGAVALASTVLKFFQLALRKDSAIATDNATELSAINANGGSGGGAYANTTDSQEALRDRGDAAWITGAAPLDAAGTRAALGMSSANLDTQLDNLPTAAENADAIWDENITTHSAPNSAGEALQNAGGGGAGFTVQDIVDGVWDEPMADHLDSGSTGASLNGAGSAGDPWSTTLPGAYGPGTAGYAVGTNLDAAVSSRSTLNGAGVQSAMTSQGYTTARAGYMDVLNGIIAAIWAYSARVLTAGTNIVLAKGTGITGFNDLSAAQVNAEVDTALADYDAPTKAEMDAGFAALNNLSQSQVYSAAYQSLLDYHPSTSVEMQNYYNNTAALIDALPTAIENADAYLDRDMAAGPDTNPRSPRNAMRPLRNKVSMTVTPGKQTVYKENDTTVAWIADLTTDAAAEPITSIDPA